MNHILSLRFKVLLLIVIILQMKCLYAYSQTANYKFEVKGMHYQILNNSDVSLIKNSNNLCPSDSQEIILGNVEFSGKQYRVTKIASCAFDGCNCLSVRIPNTVEIIESNSFYYCKDLISVYIPASVKKILRGAFSGCDNLKSINVDINNKFYQSYLGVLYNKNKKVLLQYPYGLEGVFEIPQFVDSIGDFAFSSCNNLNSIRIPNSIKDIGAGAFCSCEWLKNVTIPNDITTIKEHTFRECISLQNIIIPNSVKSIQVGAFANCYNLASIIIPNSVKEIGYCAFSNCKSIEYINIPNSVTRISAYAFRDCKRLKGIAIPDSINVINEGIFAGCDSISVIVIPESLKEINSTFYNCNQLTSVANFSLIPQNLLGSMFLFPDTLHIRKGCMKLYRSAIGWRDFKVIKEDLLDNWSVYDALQALKGVRKKYKIKIVYNQNI